MMNQDLSVIAVKVSLRRFCYPSPPLASLIGGDDAP